jgi:hypothetical protein
MWVWRETREKWLLAAALAVLVMIVLINLKLDLWPFLKGGQVAALLRADATGSVASDLLVGLFSAYVFYVIVELVPKHRKEQNTLKPLNLLAASIIDAYERCRIYGHETTITSISTEVLSLDNLKSRKTEVVTKTDVLRLKFAMETAHSRYPDLQHSLTLAASISPEHALDWLVLTDKVRLLAENHSSWPISPYTDNLLGEPTDEQRMDPAHALAHAKYKDDLNMFANGLRLRVLEVIEATIYWVELQSN